LYIKQQRWDIGMQTIMVVDDALVMRNLMGAILRQAGYLVVEMCDGVEALKYARENRVDMVISDINMPNMNGISLVSKLRRLETYADIPILMITTESSDYKKTKAKNMGADGWLQKPIDEKRVLKAVTSMFVRKKCA